MAPVKCIAPTGVPLYTPRNTFLEHNTDDLYTNNHHLVLYSGIYKSSRYVKRVTKRVGMGKPRDLRIHIHHRNYHVCATCLRPNKSTQTVWYSRRLGCRDRMGFVHVLYRRLNGLAILRNGSTHKSNSVTRSSNVLQGWRSKSHEPKLN